MSEQYLIDQIVIHVGLYKQYGSKEYEVGFYKYLEDLRVLKGLNTQDDALDYAIALVELVQAA